MGQTQNISRLEFPLLTPGGHAELESWQVLDIPNVEVF